MTPLQDWPAVLDYWFPATLSEPDPVVHHAQFLWWFQGGSTPTLGRFAATYEAARTGALDQWRAAPRSRLALILVLDQFSRGLFAGTPQAYATDHRALRIAEEGFDNGHYAALETAWERMFFLIATAHPEGPDHLARMDRIAALQDDAVALVPPSLRALYDHGRAQGGRHRAVIARFGRHPHRNAVLGRASTPAELAYIAAGDFPHERMPPAP